MKLLVDGRVLEGTSSGVRDIASGLIRGLRSLQHLGQLDLTVATVGAARGESDIQLPGRLFMHAWLPLTAIRGGYDRILVPRQTVPLISVVRRVPVFHDVGFIEEPELYPQARAIEATTRLASRARFSFAVSAYTADRLRHLRLNDHVVPLSIGAVHAVDWAPETEAPYLLCIAAQEPHKNLPRLVEAWSLLDEPNARLVICGRPGQDSMALQDVIKRLQHPSSVEIASDLTDDAYQQLLAGAYGYVQPSLYEGLCIPAMDMAAAGVPMVVGNRSNLGTRFAGAPAGQVVDATDVRLLATSLRSLLHDDEFREASSSFNRGRVGPTDWDHVAQTMIESLR